VAPGGAMTTYAVAHLRNVNMGPSIVEYLYRMDDTLEPFGGRFLVHGAPVEVREGAWPGDLIIIEFPVVSSPVRGTSRPHIN
jgi:uncharacterized protein (DUF1330 family)